MFDEKKYAIIIEHPNLNFSKIDLLIDKIYSMGLIPIIFLQEGNRWNNIINTPQKIEYFQNKNPKLYNLNFYLLEVPYINNDEKNLIEWFNNVRNTIENINVNAFGTLTTSTTDKLIVTNINDIYLLNKSKAIVSNIDTTIKDFFTICDILNIRTNSDEKWLDHYTQYFSKRDFDEIYFDDNLSTIFKDTLKLYEDNRMQFYIIDQKYLDLIQKYNLGIITYSESEKKFDVLDSEIDTISEFLSLSKVNFNINNNKISIKP